MPTGAITICLDEPGAYINPNLYGHFAEHLGACIEGGLWVGEGSPIPNIGGIRRDAVEALRAIHPPVLRWPGGCFADDYHWEDGVGPRAQRPRRVNIWWGQAIETNAFGTQEFVQLCRLIGAQPYVCGNVGSGSPRELRDWVEYCNFPGDSTLALRRAADGSPAPLEVRYWGVGNENWGCGGNLGPEEYAVQYGRFATYLHDLGETPLYLIACGPNGNNPEWTRRFFERLGGFRRLHGFAAHYYCGTAGTASEYTTDQWYELLARSLRVEELITEQRALMDRYDPGRAIGLIVDEWGAWHPPTPGRNPHHLWQQNTIRDALVAALTLDAFNRHAAEVVMANIAQVANVLQAMVLTEGEHLITTPTYHVYDMYQAHQGGTGLRAAFEAPDIAFAVEGHEQRLPGLVGSASLKGATLTLSAANPHAEAPLEVTVQLRNGRAREGAVTTLAAPDIHAHNTFEEPEAVHPHSTRLAVSGSAWRHTLPPASVTVFTVPLE